MRDECKILINFSSDNLFDFTILRIILGIMAGMSRDKCGSGVVAGFLQCVAKLKPKGIKVIGGMAMVSQSIFIALLSLITLLF